MKESKRKERPKANLNLESSNKVSKQKVWNILKGQQFLYDLDVDMQPDEEKKIKEC